jgi:predicted porin
VYFQHSNSAIKNLNLFASFEVDLYKLENDQPKNTLSLTSLYLSARYRFSRRFSLFGSYDNRKNVIYYETFRNFTDELLQQASRQGVRFRFNYRPINYLIVSASAGKRFRKEDPRPTKTLNGFVNYTRLPGINASLSLTGNLMQTSYLDGQVYGARLSKDLLDGRLYSMLHYRWVDFKYLNSITELKQHIGEIDFSYQFNKNLFLSVNFEATFQGKDIFNRLYLSLRKKL